MHMYGKREQERRTKDRTTARKKRESECERTRGDTTQGA